MLKRPALRVAALTFLTATLFTIVSVLANFLSVVAVPRETVRSNILHSLENGHFSAGIKLPLAKQEMSALSSNDCLIMSMMALPYKSISEEAVSPYLLGLQLQATPGIREDEGWTCGVTRLSVQENATIEPDGFYHRYLHGYRTIMRLLLGGLDVHGMQVAVFAVLLLMTATILVASGRDGWRLRGRPQAARPTAYAAVSFTLLAWYGLPLYGWWTSYALADIVTIGFLATAYFVPWHQLSAGRRTVLVALFGCLTAYFEFLTGGLLIGACILAGVVAIEGRGQSGRQLLADTVEALCVFGVAAALCFALKMALVTAMFGTQELAVFGKALSYRASGTILTELTPHLMERYRSIGLDPAIVDKSLLLRIAMMCVGLLHATYVLAYGSTPLGAALLLLSFAILGLHLLLLIKDRKAEQRAADLTLLASVLILPVWYLTFINHTILNAIFMVRPLAWVMAVALALTVMRLTDRAAVRAGRGARP